MTWSYQVEYISCGKKCKSCPHGPYWYRYQKQSGKTIKEYVGKFMAFQYGVEGAQEMMTRDPRRLILKGDTATPNLAYAILGLKPGAGPDETRRAFDTLASFCRQDLDALHPELALLTCAYTYLRVFNDWR